MRIAILSDIHANIQALEAVLRDCDIRKTDEFWLLGDYVGYGAAPKAVLRTIQGLGKFRAVPGNHDACLFLSEVRPSQTPHGYASYLFTREIMMEEPDAFAWLAKITQTPIEVIAEEKAMLVHGTPSDPYWGRFNTCSDKDIDQILDMMFENDVKILITGHSHIASFITRNGCIILNPGSVGQPRNGCPLAQYAILENGNVTFCRVQYDIMAAADDIKTAGMPERLWSRLYNGT